MFLGPKLSTVFASRWKALAWSAGVLMTAYCSIPSQDDDDGQAATADPNVAMAAGMMGINAGSQAESQVSPWAPASPAPAK